MNKNIAYIIMGLILSSFIACEKDEIDTFSGKDSIYFTWPVEGTSFNNATVYPDSTGVSFAFIPPTKNDTIIKLPVSVQGMLSDVDRKVSLKVSEESTAVKGVHFDYPERIVFRANVPTDSIPVTLYRTPEMKQESFQMILQLVENEDFSTEMAYMENESTGEILNYTKFQVSISDIIETPQYWFEPYLGDFTAKKLFLMSDVLGIPTDTFNNPVSISDMQFYGQFMARYLDEKAAAGETVYEDDGTEMEMGRLI